jgi:hypothetical protein
MIHGFYRVNVQGLGFMIHGFYRVNVLDQRFVSRPKLCRFSGAKSNLDLVHHAKHNSDPRHEINMPVPRRRRLIRPV